MSKIIFIVIFLMSFLSSFGQSKSDSIEIKKTFGTVFRQNGKNLTARQLFEVTQSNPEAYKEMKIAKSNYDIGFVFGFAGGFLVGWQVGTSLAGGEPNWAMAGIGAGLIVVSIPFSTAYTKHATNAVKLYNSGLKQTGLNNVDLKLGLTGNGIGLWMTF
jgi:hypothetical protein